MFRISSKGELYRRQICARSNEAWANQQMRSGEIACGKFQHINLATEISCGEVTGAASVPNYVIELDGTGITVTQSVELGASPGSEAPNSPKEKKDKEHA